MMSDFNLALERGREVGLELNLVKCEAFVFGGEEKSKTAATDLIQQAAPEISFPSRENLCLLGFPLLAEGTENALKEMTAAIQLLIDRLEKLQAHHALYILKNCLSAS